MYSDLRETTYRLLTPELGDRAGYITDLFIMGLIAVNVAAVMMGTVDSFAARFDRPLWAFELFSIAVFTVEYGGRIWSAVEDPSYDGVVSGRVTYAARPLLVVDLLAILPFYLAVFGVAGELRFLRAMRLVRFLRLLKLARYSESLQSFSVVLKNKTPDLVVAGFVNTILLVVTSSAMYYFENRAQPETFSSIPEALWWGVITLTTVGYGDTVPVTPLGRVMGALTAVLGIGLFALPASILASGFLEAARDETTECPHCGEDIDHTEL